MNIPPQRAESNPNILGFIDESPDTGPGKRLQLQWEGIEIRTERILNFLQNLQIKINGWESSIKINVSYSSIEINHSYNV